jgi:hypothetical protein
MNDTHTADIDDGLGHGDSGPGDPIANLAALDPADAPKAAEDYARELAAELEEAGAPPANPVQLRADLGDPSESADS